MNLFSHINQKGDAFMTDVSGKPDTERQAVAAGKITMSEECFSLLTDNKISKGDVLGTARIAGIMGAKKASELIPLCHIIALTKAELDLEPNEKDFSVTAVCKTKSVGKTGVEMEALTGVSTALLTIYDMCKAVDRGMIIGDIHLVKKSGGKSGVWEDKP